MLIAWTTSNYYFSHKFSLLVFPPHGHCPLVTACVGFLHESNSERVRQSRGVVSKSVGCEGEGVRRVGEDDSDRPQLEGHGRATAAADDVCVCAVCSQAQTRTQCQRTAV